MKQVTLPDGRILELTGNETPEQLNQLKTKLRQQYPEQQQKSFKELAPRKQTRGRAAVDSVLQGITANFADEIIAPVMATTAAALSEPEALLTGEIKDPALSNQIATIPQQLEQEREDQMRDYTATTIGGNILGALLGGGAVGTTKAGGALANFISGGKLWQRMGKGAIAGAATAGLYGAGDAETGERVEGAYTAAIPGVALGAAAPAVGAGVASAMPKVDDAMAGVTKLAQKYDIPVSLDQVTGSRTFQNMQKVSQELPGSGQDAFRAKQMKAFNKALFKTIGSDSDSFTRMNIDKAYVNIGNKFDKFAKGKTFQADEMIGAIQEVMEDAPTYATGDAVAIAQKNIDNIVAEIQDGVITGEKLNKLRSKVNAAARKTKDVDAKGLLKELENVVITTMTKGDGGALKKAKQEYRNFLVLEPLLAKAKGGDIVPGQLTNRVNRIYGRQFVRGKAGEIGELADIGRELLPELGGSDTATRLIYTGIPSTAMGAALGVGNNAALAGITGGLALNRGMQSFINRNQRLIQKLTPAQQQELVKLTPGEARKALGVMLMSGQINNAVAEGVIR